MKIEDKKGSHVSFIISFILFISFLIFFIGIIKPFEKVETGKSSLLKHLEDEIIKSVSDDVLVISALEDQSADCLEINNLNIKNYIAKQEGNLLKIYSSDEFPSNAFSCNPAQQGYEIGLIRTQKYVIQSKVLELNDSYNADYKTLKENFGIPEANDFEFSLLDINKNSLIKTEFKEIPQIEVFAESIPVTYFDENEGIKNGHMRIAVW